jgi:TRAP-type C4-dicarboxylate transport system permease small subunit
LKKNKVNKEKGFVPFLLQAFLTNSFFLFSIKVTIKKYMKQFFNIVMEKFFALLVGTILLAIIVVGMQIAVNFGSTISQATISMGWMMVAIWMGLITMLCLVQLNKNSENNE